MQFDRLLDSFDGEAGQKVQVALVFYYFEESESNTDVTQSDIKDVIEHSRSSISPSSVNTYTSRLQGDKWITSTENNGYRLTHDGKSNVQELLDTTALQTSRSEDEYFIDTEVVDEDHYKKLIADINKCYRQRIYDGSMVLTRKLFENLVFQILKTHYAGRDVQMFYDQENNRHYSFDDLLNNLKTGVPTLRRYSRELDKNLVEDIRELKDAGNEGAHSIRVDFTDEEIDGLADDATHYVEVLFDVLVGARIADKQSSD